MSTHSVVVPHSARPVDSTQPGEADRGLLVGEVPDLRLLIPAAGAWAGAIGGGVLEPSLVCWLAVGLLVAGVVAISCLRRRRHVSFVLCAASWCTAGAMLAGAWGAAAAIRGPLPALAAQRAKVTLEIVVTGDPHLSAPSAGLHSRQVEVVPARAVEVSTSTDTTRIRSPIVLLASGDGWSGLLPSQHLRAVGRLAPASPGEPEAAVFDARGSPADVTNPSRVQRVAGRIRAGMRAAAQPLPSAPRGLLPGLVDGDTSGLSPQLQAAFRATGLTHIVAVSGANVAILLGAVLVVARWVGLRLRGQAMAGALAIVGFVVVARPGASVLRAAAMGLIAVLALATGRRARALPSLCAAVLVLILVDPALATSAGFALSVLATAGLVVLAPVLREWLVGWLPRWLAEAISVPAAATLVCAPIIVMISGQISLSSIPANLLAEPGVAPATVLGVLAACAAPIALPLARLLAGFAGLPCDWLIFVARTFSRIPGSTLSWPTGVRGAVELGAVMLVLSCLVAIWRARQRHRTFSRRIVAVLAAVALAGGAVASWRVVHTVWPPHDWPPRDWAFAACDVGQGDALLFRVDVSSAVLVDAGPDPVAVDRCLRQLRVRQLAAVLFTGFAAAEVDGIAGALSHRQVGIVEAAQPLPPTPVADRLGSMLATAGVELSVAPVGEHRVIGAVSWQVLGPVWPYRDTGADESNDSLVVRVTVAGFSVLVTGDIEAAAEDDLLTAGLPSAQVLVVPHHGGVHQDGRFLTAMRPLVAVVSVGTGNPAGAPVTAVLDDLQTSGASISRTDLDGSLAIEKDDGRLDVVAQHGARRVEVATTTLATTGRRTVPGTSRQAEWFSRSDLVVNDAVDDVLPQARPGSGMACCGTWSLLAFRSRLNRSPWWSVTMNSWSSARSPPLSPSSGRKIATRTSVSWRQTRLCPANSPNSPVRRCSASVKSS